MRGLIPDQQLHQVREATDLVALVGREVELNKKGASFWGLCPFHNEKSPSFHVLPDKQIFKCFGCGKGGNAFDWVMDRLGFSFPEAVRHLARDAGIEIIDEGAGADRSEGPSRQSVLDALEWAAGRYASLLGSPEADASRRYIVDRGFRRRTIEEFRIGFARDLWDGILSEGQSRGFKAETLEAAGLVVRKEGADRLYDRFRGRIIFPIADVTGKIRAFGARAMGDAQPKYLNSPEGPLFHKGRTLFGLPQARETMQKTGRAVLVEGYTDVMMAHQVGCMGVVAGLGTALTQENAAQVRRYARHVVLVYDGDEAGRKAALSALGVFLSEEIAVRVAFLPEGRDPCDVALSEGREGLEQRLDAALDAPRFVAEGVARQARGSSEERSAAAKEAVEMIRRAVDPVQRADLVHAVSEALGVSESVIIERLGLSRRKRTRQATSTANGPRRPDSIDPEHWAIQAALFDIKRLRRLAVAPLTGEDSRRIVGRALQLAEQTEDGSATVAALLIGLSEDEAALVTRLTAEAEGRGEEALARQFEDCLRRIEAARATNPLAARLGWVPDGTSST